MSLDFTPAEVFDCATHDLAEALKPSCKCPGAPTLDALVVVALVDGEPIIYSADMFGAGSATTALEAALSALASRDTAAA